MSRAHYYDYFDTPLGAIKVTATEQAVRSICFVDGVGTKSSNAVTELCKQQMLEYFAGQRQTFDLPLDPQGTDFQKQVWQALTAIDYGETSSYSDIANKINNPKAVRAVGAANGKNPIGIVVPCHRVIGRDGSMTGYAFGVDKKRWLLNHESKIPELF